MRELSFRKDSLRRITTCLEGGLSVFFRLCVSLLWPLNCIEHYTEYMGECFSSKKYLTSTSFITPKNKG